MRIRFFAIFFLLMIPLWIVSAAARPSNSFTVLTWNILGHNVMDVEEFKDPGNRNDDFTKGDMSRFKRHWIDVIQPVKPDVICLQELDNPNTHSLSKVLQSNGYTFVSHQSKGKNGGTALFCKTNRFHVVQSGKIGLPYTGSTQDGAAAWGLLEDVQTKRKLLITSVHVSRGNTRSFQSIGNEQWRALVSQLIPVLVQYKPAVVFAGDFNTLYEEVLADTKDFIANLIRYPIQIYGHNSFTVTNPRGEFAAIDHVLFEGLSVVGSASQIGDGSYDSAVVKSATNFISDTSKAPIFRKLPSDHAPIFVTFNYGSGSGVAVAKAGGVGGGAAASGSGGAGMSKAKQAVFAQQQQQRDSSGESTNLTQQQVEKKIRELLQLHQNVAGLEVERIFNNLKNKKQEDDYLGISQMLGLDFNNVNIPWQERYDKVCEKYQEVESVYNTWKHLIAGGTTTIAHGKK